MPGTRTRSPPLSPARSPRSLSFLCPVRRGALAQKRQMCYTLNPHAQANAWVIRGWLTGMVGATRTKQEQSSERREEILAIAARLIARRGYSATTVRDIAEEAGILSGSLYHHFASKEAMLEEILHGFMDRLLTRYDEIATSVTDPRAGIDALIECSFETIDREPAAVGLYQNEAAFLATQPGFEFLATDSERIAKIWIDQLRSGQESGVFRAEGDPAVTYRFIRDAVWSTVHWYRPGGRHTVESMTTQFLELLHRGLGTP